MIAAPRSLENVRSTRQSSGGVALILTLGTVVLLTVLVLAFFVRAQVNRQISFSSTNLIKADTLARAALDVIVGELRAEMTDTTHSTATTSSNVTFYQPVSTADWLPRQSGVNAATGPLVKVSASGIPIRSSGTITGSSVSIGSASLNGRSLSTARWFTSANSSPQIGSQGTLPTWLFMTRGNGIKTPAIATAKDSTGNDYVIGRFAFTVYDLGSLIDATVAGYPVSTPFATPAADVGLKASLAYTDLSALGLSAANIDKFISWRNATSTDADGYLEWAAGIPRSSGISNYAALSAARSGHRSIALGDNTLLTRHDLLSQPNVSGAAGSLTHFSRTLNAPSYNPAFPTAPAAYNATANPNLGILRFSAALSITHYRDDGTTESYSVLPGDPFLQRRFSLAKLAWIGSNGPNASAFSASLTAAQRTQAIADCFGLDWDSVNARWRYTPLNGSSAIKTLGEVIGDNREPNFFEWLKAGLLDGSLARASDNKTLAHNTYKAQTEASKDLHILRIGASVIDSADADNYPTTLVLSGQNVPVHGVEDLPYLFGMQLGRISTSATASGQQTVSYCAFVGAPLLFNPHASRSTSASPANLRVRVVTGTMVSAFNSLYGNTAGKPLARTGINTDMPTTMGSLSSFVIPGSSFESFRSRVDTYHVAASGSILKNLVSTIASADSTSSGFVLYQYTGLPETFTATTSASIMRFQMDNFLLALEFQDSTGNWRMYDTLAGNEAFTTANGIGNNSYITVGPTFSSFPNNNQVTYALLKLDPRTTRFGVSLSSRYLVATQALIPTDAATPYGYVNNTPFGSGNLTEPGSYPGLWAEGNTTSWNDSLGAAIGNVSDPDGVTRPADAWLDGTNANLYRNLTDTLRRPVVLQRPFRSVAELGQVFRDNPGKTINFFDPTSGDKALLDLFNVCDEPAVTAGRASLNTTQTKIHQALFTATAQAADGSLPLSNPAALATAYNTFAFTAGSPTANLPVTLANAVTFISSASLPVGGTGSLDGIKYHREAVLRSLSGTTQTRTWNLLIDVVAQCGHYPATASALDNFIVEGERRYWLSVAIDRLTGKIIDQQLEPDND